MKKRFSVSNKRSLLKAITFRLLIIVSDSFVIFFITHRFDVTFGVIFFSNIASTIFYFIHERVWNTINIS